ncbi:Uncharacterised protein [Serratia fonticola]|uniref:Uncharacterized protein n=1 Tax=Serratia fonticola TaxID=47917 RepID=A0A4U9W1A4_SERFO|nr:Uncharacterised protein [Serratia fonticola]
MTHSFDHKRMGDSCFSVTDKQCSRKSGSRGIGGQRSWPPEVLQRDDPDQGYDAQDSCQTVEHPFACRHVDFQIVHGMVDTV